MWTSYYHKAMKHPKALSISIGKPADFKGGTADELCPTWAMVKRGYPYEEYVEMLERRGVDPHEVVKKYQGRILLCFEADRGKCHRGYLARWLKEMIGYELPEWPGDNDLFV